MSGLGSWAQIAERFLAITANDEEDWFVAHQAREGWILHPVACKGGSRTGWGSPKVTEFVALAKLCLTRLGEPAASDEEALQRWMERIITETPGLEAYREPVDKRRICRGPNVLAAAFCRHYEAEEAIGALRAPARRAYPKRAAWLQQILKRRDYTSHRFATMNNIEPRTVKKILDGHPVQDAVLERLATAVECHVGEIPSD